MGQFIDAQRNQRLLLPPSIDEVVAQDHPVRLFDEVIGQMEPTLFRSGYNNTETGRPAYEPMILLRIMLWGYLQGERSSRKIARACGENLVYIYLAGSYRPDFRTLCLFRKRNGVLFEAALKEIIKIGKKLSLSSFAHVNIDGTKIRADASFGAQCTEEQLQKRAEELAKAIMREAEEADTTEDKDYGESDGYAHLPKTLSGKKERLRRIEEAKKELRKAPDAQTANETDPESRYVKDIRGCGYNAQAVVDSESRLITAEGVTNNLSDNAQLVPQIEKHKENTGAESGTAAADAGYTGGKNLRDCGERRYEPYIPQGENIDTKRQKRETRYFAQEDFTYEEGSDAYRCPAGKLLKFHHNKVKDRATGEVKIKVYKCSECTGCEVKRRCTDSRTGRELHISEYDKELRAVRERLGTVEGKKRYAKRKSTVETVFGYIKRILGFRRFSLRGLVGARTEWSLVCLVYDIRRMMTLFAGG